MGDGGPGEAAPSRLWVGAAGLCVDADGRVLLVLQGRADEPRGWAIPAGGLEAGESPEACCARELWEETGYRIAVGRRAYLKTGTAGGRPFLLHVFEAQVVGGTSGPRDPDGLIHEVRWCGVPEVERLAFGFPEDRGYVLDHMARMVEAGRGPDRAFGPRDDGKLVRDGIPDQMARSGRPGWFRAAPWQERPDLLLRKVREEAAEVAASGGDVEEVADLLEVLAALAEQLGLGPGEIEAARAGKRGRSGDFVEGWVLRAAADGPDPPA